MKNKYLYNNAIKIEHKKLSGPTITVYGQNFPNKQKMFVDHKLIIPLRVCRVSECDFPWFDYKNSDVILENVYVDNELDVKCLRWLVAYNSSVTIERTNVSQNAFNSIPTIFEPLSSITNPGELKIKN